MPSVRVRYRYPHLQVCEGEGEVSVPDGVDPEAYVREHQVSLLKTLGGEEATVSHGGFDAGFCLLELIGEASEGEEEDVKDA